MARGMIFFSQLATDSLRSVQDRIGFSHKDMEFTKPTISANQVSGAHQAHHLCQPGQWSSPSPPSLPTRSVEFTKPKANLPRIRKMWMPSCPNGVATTNTPVHCIFVHNEIINHFSTWKHGHVVAAGLSRAQLGWLAHLVRLYRGPNFRPKTNNLITLSACKLSQIAN